MLGITVGHANPQGLGLGRLLVGGGKQPVCTNHTCQQRRCNKVSNWQQKGIWRITIQKLKKRVHMADLLCKDHFVSWDTLNTFFDGLCNINCPAKQKKKTRSHMDASVSVKQSPRRWRERSVPASSPRSEGSRPQRTAKQKQEANPFSVQIQMYSSQHTFI